MVKFQKNQVLTLDVSETNMMGFGVAKIDGMVFFIQNGVEGDRCAVRIIKVAKNYCVARIEEILKPSPRRIEPVCKHFRRCGGCAFQHVSYEHEKELKRRSVAGFLQKEGLFDLSVSHVLSTECMEGYRNKAQFPVALDETGRVICSFYAPKTHKVCSLDECSIQNPLFIPIAKRVCAFLTDHRVPVYCEETGQGLVRHIYLRIAQSTGQMMLALVLSKNDFPQTDAFVSWMTQAFPQISSICFNIQPQKNNVILGKEVIHLYGDEKITDVFCNRKLMISPLSFYQVNHDAAELLYQTAFSMSDLCEFDRIIDLYCGIGSISLSAEATCPITGIEIIPEAVKDANENAKLNGVNSANYICGDATDAFRLIRETNAKNPLLILDPPRKGLHADLIEEISRHFLQNVLYISCGPDTFARDLALFKKQGYEISSVQPVDLFPRTAHVECIAFLTRKEAKHSMMLNPRPYQMIKSGEKTIELRLWDEKRRNVKIGDRIVFTNNATGESLISRVLNLHFFSDFDELYSSLPLSKCGYTVDHLDRASPRNMLQYYSIEMQKKYGVVGIELCEVTVEVNEN